MDETNDSSGLGADIRPINLDDRCADEAAVWMMELNDRYGTELRWIEVVVR